MKSRIILFVIAMLVWFGLTWSFDWEHIFFGVLVSILVSILIGDLFSQRPSQFMHLQRYLWFLYYIPYFLWQCIKANVDVAYRVLHPALPVKPGIVKVKTSLKSETGLTFLANSITLTPGTMSVDIDRENGCLYIHWIYVKDIDVDAASGKIVEHFEKILKRIFE